MSNFSFSHSVFYSFGDLSPIFIKSKIVVCKLFQCGRVQNLLFGKGLKFGLCDGDLMTLKTTTFENLVEEHVVNFLPNDKILNTTKLKAIADDKLNEVHIITSGFYRLEKHFEKSKYCKIKSDCRRQFKCSSYHNFWLLKFRKTL